MRGKFVHGTGLIDGVLLLIETKLFEAGEYAQFSKSSARFLVAQTADRDFRCGYIIAWLCESSV